MLIQNDSMASTFYLCSPLWQIRKKELDDKNQNRSNQDGEDEDAKDGDDPGEGGRGVSQ